MRRLALMVILVTAGCTVTTTTSTVAPVTSTTAAPTTSTTTTAAPTTTITAPSTTTTTETTVLSPSIISQARSDESSLYRLTVITPVVQNVEGASTINTAIADTIGRAVDQFLIDAAQTGTEAIAGPNLLQISYQVGVITTAVVSIELDITTYWSGAAHPSSTATTMTFISGAPVDVAQHLGNRDAFATAIASHIADAYGGSAQRVLDDAGGVDGLLSLAHLLVTQDGVIAVFDQYAVAPGAAGIVRVSVPVSLTDWPS